MKQSCFLSENFSCIELIQEERLDVEVERKNKHVTETSPLGCVGFLCYMGLFLELMY
jgi:hypothetical protein